MMIVFKWFRKADARCQKRSCMIRNFIKVFIAIACQNRAEVTAIMDVILGRTDNYSFVFFFLLTLFIKFIASI